LGIGGPGLKHGQKKWRAQIEAWAKPMASTGGSRLKRGRFPDEGNWRVQIDGRK